MKIASSPLPWYGVRVKSKHEQLAFVVLRGKGYEPFLPSYRVRRRWTDRVAQFSIAGARLALEDARFEIGDRGDEIGVYMGTALGGLAYAEQQHETFLAQGLGSLAAGALAAYLHGRAGEAAASVLTPVSVTGEDIPEYLPIAIGELLGQW